METTVKGSMGSKTEVLDTGFTRRTNKFFDVITLTLSTKNAHVEAYYEDVLRINSELARTLAELKAGEKVNLNSEMKRFSKELEHILKDLHVAVQKDINVGNHERALQYLRTYNQAAQTLESKKAQEAISKAAQKIERDLLGKRQKSKRRSQTRKTSVRAAK